MVEPRRELYLTKKALGPERCSEIGVKNLERDNSIVLAVLGEVDGSHPSPAKLAINDIRIGQRCAKPFYRKGHSEYSRTLSEPRSYMKSANVVPKQSFKNLGLSE
jgi:hypothetical protein